MTLGSAVYETSYIDSKGDYSAGNLVTDFSEMVYAAKDLQFSAEDTQTGADRRSYVLLRHRHNQLWQTVLFPQDYLKVPDEFLTNLKYVAPEIEKTVRDRLRPFEKSLWSN